MVAPTANVTQNSASKRRFRFPAAATFLANSAARNVALPTSEANQNRAGFS